MTLGLVRIYHARNGDKEEILKKIICLCLSAVMALSMVVFASADDEKPVNYMAMMIEAALTGDYETGEYAENERNAKIEESDLEYTKISFNDLYLLAKIIYAEAGSEWLSDEWKMCVGEVVLNRVASPEYPNTIAEVIYQKGQYYSESSRYFKNLKPSVRCVRLALRLLEGERVMNDPSVVFQANFRQGSGVCLKLRDSLLGSTYFCYSNHPELYTKVEEAA